ncbi:MAG: DUF3696 domain-containing protein [Chloroflexota bacterium]|nr:DUF3696 domain-containing protein [Chloroflexota bacterium]
MFTKMRMRNFKSWVDTGEVRLAPLTGIFGTNSSGKSSLLQMLLLLKQTTESNDRKLVLKTGNLQDGYVNLGTISEITHGDSTELTMDVSWHLPTTSSTTRQTSANDNLPSIQVTVPETGDKFPIDALAFSTTIFSDKQSTYVSRISYDADRFRVEMVRGKNNQYSIRVNVGGTEPERPQGRPRVFMSPEKCYGFSDEALRFYQNTGYLSDIVLSLEQQFKRVYYLGPLRGYPQRSYNWAGESPSGVGMTGELAISALLAGKRANAYPVAKRGKQLKLEERVAKWLVEMGMASSFHTKQLIDGGNQYEVRLKRTSQSHEVLITDMGFGVSQVLPVLVLCYYAPPGSTLIFEQPEIHLHPAVQSVLADVFIDVIKNRRIQLIIESHSEHLLRRLQRRIAEEQITREQTALYFCDLTNGQSRISELEIDVFGNIRNWPKDFFGDLTGDMFEIAQNGIQRQMANGN